MLTRDQYYAINAHKNVQRVHNDFEEAEAKKYGVMSHKLPILIHNAGLVQALTFVDARSKERKDKTNMHTLLLDDLAGTIGRENRAHLLQVAREAELAEYILLTRQLMNALLWYKRFAQSILHVETDEDEDNEVV